MRRIRSSTSLGTHILVQAGKGRISRLSCSLIHAWEMSEVSFDLTSLLSLILRSPPPRPPAFR